MLFQLKVVLPLSLLTTVNSETMVTPEGTPHTAHTTVPVPVIVTKKGVTLREGGRLADVAPTMLDLLNVAKPEEMTGEKLNSKII